MLKIPITNDMKTNNLNLHGSFSLSASPMPCPMPPLIFPLLRLYNPYAIEKNPTNTRIIVKIKSCMYQENENIVINISK